MPNEKTLFTKAAPTDGFYMVRLVLENGSKDAMQLGAIRANP